MPKTMGHILQLYSTGDVNAVCNLAHTGFRDLGR